MRPRIRSWLGLVLALMLALTGQSMAVARGASASTGQMVLCTGTGPVTVHVDARGKPTAPPHVCPDCLSAPFDMLIDESPLQMPRMGHAQHDVANFLRFVLAPAASAYRTRAPPRLQIDGLS